MKNFAFKLDGISDAVLGRVSAIPVGDCKDFTFIGGQITELLNPMSLT